MLKTFEFYLHINNITYIYSVDITSDITIARCLCLSLRKRDLSFPNQHLLSCNISWELIPPSTIMTEISKKDFNKYKLLRGKAFQIAISNTMMHYSNNTVTISYGIVTHEFCFLNLLLRLLIHNPIGKWPKPDWSMCNQLGI